jgi:hypothetical protein
MAARLYKQIVAQAFHDAQALYFLASAGDRRQFSPVTLIGLARALDDSGKSGYQLLACVDLLAKPAFRVRWVTLKTQVSRALGGSGNSGFSALAELGLAGASTSVNGLFRYQNRLYRTQIDANGLEWSRSASGVVLLFFF